MNPMINNLTNKQEVFIMLYPVLNSNNWLSNAFDDFFHTDWMPKMNATAPAVNVKESDKAYTMEIAAPGLKKEYCRINIDKDGYLSVKIENKFENKEEDKKEGKKEHYLRREFSYSTMSRAIRCLTMSIASTYLQKLRMAFFLSNCLNCRNRRLRKLVVRSR